MKKILALTICALLLLCGVSSALASSSILPDNFGEGMRIGFSDVASTGPYGIRLEESIIGTGEKYGFEVLFADAQENVSKQLADIEDFIAQGVDYIVIHPVDSEGVGNALQQARDAGIPVFLVARSAVGVAGDDYVCYLCSDGEWEGLAAAAAIADKFGGSAKVVELTGTMGASIAQERYNGFHQGLEQFPGLELVASQTGNFNRSDAQKVMENIIQSTAGDFNAVYAHNDEMALGALQAIRAANLPDVAIIGIDGQADAFEAVKNGEMYATITHNPFYGELLYESIYKHINGSEVPIQIVRQEFVVTADNAEEMSDYAL